MREIIDRLLYWLKPKNGSNCHSYCLWCEYWDTHCRDYRRMEENE